MSQDTPARWKIEREMKAFRRELEADGRINLTRITRTAQEFAFKEMRGNKEITLVGIAR